MAVGVVESAKRNNSGGKAENEMQRNVRERGETDGRTDEWKHLLVTLPCITRDCFPPLFPPPKDGFIQSEKTRSQSLV